jgi:uncharacterized membrane protein SpoIIM required for sporulation
MKMDIYPLKGKHVVLTGSVLYLASLLIGIISQGIDIRGHISDQEKYTQEEKGDFIVPANYVNKIFLNNLGLNAVIITGAFSLLAFSLVVLMFNGIQTGYLIKGLTGAYDIKIALLLVMPHLIVEVFTHILSLYLAYYILSEFIVPVIVKGEQSDLSSCKAKYVLKLLVIIITATYLGAVIEVFVTPALI